MASTCDTSKRLCFVLLAAILFCNDCTAVKHKGRGGHKSQTTSTTHRIDTTMGLRIKEPDTDTIIYHSTKTNDRCECGAFKTPKKSVESPLYYQIAMQNFNCDEVKCKAMCLSLPAFNEDRGVEILCAHLNSAVGLRPAVHYKNCNDNWLFAGSSHKETICCHDGKLVKC